MNEFKELNFYNFVTDLIFHSEHAKPKDQKKSLAITIALSVLSLGIIPLAIGIGWSVGKAISWIKQKFSPADKKIKALAKDHLRAPDLAGVKGVVRYQKEAKGAPHIIPKNKEKLLGQGMYAKVHEHKNNPKLAIKVIPNSHEYEIGAMLNHPVLAKSHELFIKEYPDDRPDKYKLVMEKVDGKSLASFQQSADAIPKEIAIKLIEQAKECCIYLFQSNVYWKDVNDGNIFIENNTDNLRIIDFGHWDKEMNSEERVKHLLLGAMELTGWIVGNSSCVKKDGVKDRERKKEIAFPEEFFDEKIGVHQILSVYSYLGDSWMKKITTKLKGMDQDQMKALISNYFDHVIAKLCAAV